MCKISIVLSVGASMVCHSLVHEQPIHDIAPTQFTQNRSLFCQWQCFVRVLLRHRLRSTWLWNHTGMVHTLLDLMSRHNFESLKMEKMFAKLEYTWLNDGQAASHKGMLVYTACSTTEHLLQRIHGKSLRIGSLICQPKVVRKGKIFLC